MEAARVPTGSFDRLRVHSIGLPQVLFQSITHMAPGAAVAYSIYISVPFSRQALALSVLLALIACLCASVAIGQLAKLEPSAGGLYAYAARSLGPLAGFNLAWLFRLLEPLVAPFLYLEFGWAMREVMSSEAGWHWSGQWIIWVFLMAAIVYLLTYRDIRISTTAGVILGAFEIVVFGALAVWMLLSNAGDLNLQPFNPHHAVGSWNGVFRGMVFAILAFIGFEAAAPLGEEAKNPRRAIPRAVVGSAVAIGLFYVLCAYAWVFGAGFNNFVDQATGADPWRALGKTFWSGAWVLVFLAICNSIAANSNAAVNAATRVFYALARNRLAPQQLGRTHPVYKTPYIAIVWMTAFAIVVSMLLGWKWGPLIGFAFIATLAVIVVVAVYIIICLGCIWHYWTKRRAGFNWFLHLVVPLAGAVLFFLPPYYPDIQFPPAYPTKYANWIALGWIGAGLVLTVWLTQRAPDRLRDMDRVYVEDETVAPETGVAIEPA